MTGVGRPLDRAYRVSGGGVACETDPTMGNGANSRKISKDSLIAQGAPALADILMRACLKYPELAGELAACKPLQRTDDPEVRDALAISEGPAGEPYMVGTCAAMRVVYHAVRRFGSTDAPILLTGESGTGKELAALAIHERSPFAKGPFVAVNCAGLPASLIESELFGHEKGSFTGATGRRIGRIEEAEGGTLFLDEIGDLPMELQAKLLRFLQNQTIERVGSNQTIKIQTRVVAATNVILEEAVTSGRFRQDLFFRLDVLRIHMPALRERAEDIGLLVKYFLNQAAREFGVDGVPKITDEAIATLESYSWPGNVRELISKMRRAVIMAGDHPLGVADFDLSGPVPCAPREPAVTPVKAGADDGQDESDDPGLASARAKAERKAVAAALGKFHFNVTRAAKELGVSRVTMYKLMDRHDIQR